MSSPRGNLLAIPAVRWQATTRIDWAQEFRRLVDEIIQNNEVILAAIKAISETCKSERIPSDAPAHAIANIVAANNDLKVRALGILQTVIQESRGRGRDAGDD